MKKILIGALVLAMGLMASFAFAADGTQNDRNSTFGSTVGSAANVVGAGTGINGTVHDLGSSHNGINYTSSTDTLGRICIFCHAPHNTTRLDAAAGGTGSVAAGSGPQANAA